MRKTLITAAGPSMRPVLTNYTLPSFTSFAGRYGYKMQVINVTKDDPDRWSATAKSVRWQKLQFIRSALQQNDVVLWIDADVLICRTDTDILGFLGDTDYQGLVLHTISLGNRMNPNTGVWVIRNTEKAFRFLDKALEIGMPEGRWADQGAVLRAFEWFLGDKDYHGARMPTTPTEFMEGTTWLPDSWNQPYHKKYAGPNRVPNPFAIHFMGMSIPDRVSCMREITNHSVTQNHA